jgi:uncharacterized damage-inducible protein DinB
MKYYFQRLYQHMTWADTHVLECLHTAFDQRSLRLFAHLLSAEQVWLTRLRGEDGAPLEIWPESSLMECGILAEQNRAEYARYLEALPEKQFTTVITYRNSKGTEFTTPVQDILTHVALHGSYHRGQISSAVRTAGAVPVNTDFITFVREQVHLAPTGA